MSPVDQAKWYGEKSIGSETWGLPLTDSEDALGLCRKELALASFFEFSHPPSSFCSFMLFFPEA